MDKASPAPIATGSESNPVFTHQGWLSEDQRYLFVNEYVSQNKASDHNL